MKSTAPAPMFDGHMGCVSVDTFIDTLQDSPGVLSGAVNRTIRGGTNRTRPPFASMNLVFDTDEAESKFEGGAISGCFGYNNYFGTSSPNLIVAVNDCILAGLTYGSTIRFSILHKGINPAWMHSWFVQVEDRLYWQNGYDRPVGWDGVKPAYVIPDGDGAMPVGTAMAYAQGRLAVITIDGFVIISDYIYGNTLKDTKGAEKFFEYQQFNDIGAVSTPAQLGELMGGIAMIQPGTVNAQGPLLLLCTKGAYALDLSGPRKNWLTNGIQTIVLMGRGAGSSHAIVNANSDVWFQASDGSIQSYRFLSDKFSRQWGDASISLEAKRYLEYNPPTQLQFVSMEQVNNRILTSCAITTDKCGMGGVHRFGQGMTVCDLFTGNTTRQQSGLTWEGMWTGPNPVQFANLSVDGAQRSFVVSHDDDGKNRVYEALPDGTDDMMDGSPRSIVSFYDIPNLFRKGGQQELPVLKRMTYGRAVVSEVIGTAKVSMRFRPSLSDEWFDLMAPQVVGCPKADNPFKDRRGMFPFTRGGHYQNLQGETIQPVAEQASVRTADVAEGFDVRVMVEGSCAVNNVQCRAELVIEDTPAQPDPKDDRACDLIRLPGENDFTYKFYPCPTTPRP